MVAIASSAASLAELLAPNMHDFYLKVHAFFFCSKLCKAVREEV